MRTTKYVEKAMMMATPMATPMTGLKANRSPLILHIAYVNGEKTSIDFVSVERDVPGKM